MQPADVVAVQLEMGQWLLEQALNDLSADEWFHQPVPGAGHAAWLLGHIATSEDRLVALLTGGVPALDPSLRDVLGGQSEASQDRSRYPAPADLLAMFRSVRQRSLDSLRSVPPEAWDEPAPEGIRGQARTKGAGWALLPTHHYWHAGQILMIRRALNKPKILG